MRRLTLMILFSILAGTAASASEMAQPDWTIDTMVAKGAASTAERDTFVNSFLNSCLAQNAPVRARRMTETELQDYCKCTAAKSTSVITSGDIAYMLRNNQTLPPGVAEKIKAAARDCGGYIIERQAGQ